MVSLLYPITLLIIFLLFSFYIHRRYTKLLSKFKETSSEKNQNDLKNTFEEMTEKALEKNHSTLLNLAQSSFEKILSEAEHKWEKKEDTILHGLKPIESMMKSVAEQNQKLEENRQKMYGGLEEQMRMLTETHRELKKETGNLVSALKKPQVRGRWGEITLKRVAELAGMVEHCDFEEQKTVFDAEKELHFRPDMIVNLPGQRTLVVDAKVPLQAYLEAIETTSEKEREQGLKKHTQQVIYHMNHLAKKAYWDQFEKSPEFVVMFIPGESFFSVAVEFEKNLIEDGILQKVIIATPTTLIALLHSIAYGWRQEKLNQTAQEIEKLGREIYDRLATFTSHYAQVGKTLARSTEAYNQSVGSLESRVLVSARKFKDLGISSKSDIQPLPPVEKNPRALADISSS